MGEIIDFQLKKDHIEIEQARIELREKYTEITYENALEICQCFLELLSQ